MDYRFVRKLVKNISETDGKEILLALQEKEIEIFVQANDEYLNLTEISNCQAGELYVSAADEAYAKELLRGLGYDKYLCTQEESTACAEMTEVEKAEAEYYKKHKQNQMLALLLIGAVLMLSLLTCLQGIFML